MILNYFFESALYQTSILIILFLFLWSLTGRYLISLLIYSSSILSLFYANHQKFLQRNEPIYPNELIEIFNIKDLLTMVDIKSISLYIVYFLITCAILVLFYWKVSPIMIHAYDSLLEPDIREQFLKRKNTHYYSFDYLLLHRQVACFSYLLILITIIP